MIDRTQKDPNSIGFTIPSAQRKAAEILVSFVDAKTPVSAFHRARLFGMVANIVDACSKLEYVEDGKIFVPEFLGIDFMQASAAAYDIVALTGCHVMFKFNGMRVKIAPHGDVS